MPKCVVAVVAQYAESVREVVPDKPSHYLCPLAAHLFSVLVPATVDVIYDKELEGVFSAALALWRVASIVNKHIVACPPVEGRLVLLVARST